MARHSRIEWTDATWNPVRGCTPISPGCAHCYARTFAERFRGTAGHPFEQGFDLRLVPERLLDPLRWARPRLIFVNSMSDLFHENVPLAYIEFVCDVMAAADWHNYQVLTKRGGRMQACLRNVFPKIARQRNVWWGVSVENSRFSRVRLVDLVYAYARNTFVSFEPLLTDIWPLRLAGIDWVIVGGESGPGARPMKAAWVLDIQRQCAKAKIPFFFKQWGGPNKKATGHLLDGREYREFPEFVWNPAPPARRRKELLAEFGERLEALMEEIGG